MKAFIFEDDEKRLEWFRSRFGSENLTVTKNIPEAIRLLQTGQFERIFLDFNVGSGSGHKDNGIDVAWAIKEQNLQPDIPITIHSDDNYGIRHMSRILRDRNVETIKFPKLHHKY